MKTLSKILSYIIVAFIGGTIGFVLSRQILPPSESPKVINQIISRPLDKYSFDHLSTVSIPIGVIEQGELFSDTDDFIQYKFSHTFDPTLGYSKSAQTTGLMTLPKGDINKYPLVIMFRGYVDPSIYAPGVGTHRAAEEFAKEGFMSIAPDFLGYGGSSTNSSDVMESRFQTYTTALSVLNAVDSIPQWDHQNIFLWGHSNGGQIALTILELTRKPIPTVLWAPVSKPFPYSVLYYTDESEDKGKFLRAEVAKFESLYDSSKYSLDNYIDKITAPIELHQGGADASIPIAWSNLLAANLRTANIDIKYFTYPQADHNLRPDWDTVVGRNINFYKSNIK